MDMDISMDIHAKSVDMDIDMDGKFHIHGNPGNYIRYFWYGTTFKQTAIVGRHRQLVHGSDSLGTTTMPSIWLVRRSTA